jgi:hypothetical protein
MLLEKALLKFAVHYLPRVFVLRGGHSAYDFSTSVLHSALELFQKVLYTILFIYCIKLSFI